MKRLASYRAIIAISDSQKTFKQNGAGGVPKAKQKSKKKQHAGTPAAAQTVAPPGTHIVPLTSQAIGATASLTRTLSAAMQSWLTRGNPGSRLGNRLICFYCIPRETSPQGAARI